MTRKNLVLCLLLALWPAAAFADTGWFEFRGVKFGQHPGKEMSKTEQIGEQLSTWELTGEYLFPGSPQKCGTSCRFVYDRLTKIDLFFPATPHAVIASLREKYNFGVPLYYGDIVSDLFLRLGPKQSLRDENHLKAAAERLLGEISSRAGHSLEFLKNNLSLDSFFSGVAIPVSGSYGSAHGEIYYKEGVLFTVRDCSGGCVISFSDAGADLSKYLAEYKKTVLESLK
jgi:hypothetical protein